MTEKTYQEGVRDGEFAALKRRIDKHDDRMDGHSNRLRLLERIIWVGVGAAAFFQFVPALQGLFNGNGG